MTEYKPQNLSVPDQLEYLDSMWEWRIKQVRPDIWKWAIDLARKGLQSQERIEALEEAFRPIVRDLDTAARLIAELDDDERIDLKSYLGTATVFLLDHDKRMDQIEAAAKLLEPSHD